MLIRAELWSWDGDFPIQNANPANPVLRPPVNSRLAIMGVYTASGEPQKQMIILLSPPPPPSQALTTIYITKTKFQVFMKGAGELHSQQLWSDISEIKSPLNIFTLARNNSHYPRCVVHYLALRLDSRLRFGPHQRVGCKCHQCSGLYLVAFHLRILTLTFNKKC